LEYTAAMNYKIKIDNAFEEKGKIDLKRLITLTSGLLNIAEGSLQIRLTGTSFTRGRKAAYLNESIQIKLVGITKGSTILELETETFAKPLAKIQPDLFNDKAYHQLLNETPVSLVVRSFKDALNEYAPKDNLDKGLLNELKKFSEVLKTPDEKINFINQGSFSELKLNKNDFEKIEILEKQIPEPKEIILNGKLDLLEHTKTRAKIITKQGIVEAYLSNEVTPEDIRDFWGTEVTIAGTANYRADGKLGFVEIKKIFKPGKGDSYFSLRPDIESTEQQIERQLRERAYKNKVGEIVGIWPGEEDINTLLDMLNK
jgi:hypothetical protein